MASAFGLLLLGAGLVLVIEGLVWALAPQMIEDLLAALRALTTDQRRLVGLFAIAAGVVLLWLAHSAGLMPRF